MVKARGFCGVSVTKMSEQTRTKKHAGFTGRIRAIDRRRVIIVILAIIALAAVSFIIVRPHAWPFYSLLALWGIVLIRFRSRSGLLFAAVFTLVAIMYAWLGGSVIATLIAGPGERFRTFLAWWGAPVETIVAMLWGNPGAGQVRARWFQSLLWCVPAAMALSGLAVVVNKNDDRKTLHGSAQFAEPSRAGLTSDGKGFLLGREKGGMKREVILPSREVHEHILMDGAPGAGKSTSIFIPNLLRIAHSGCYANLVVTDPKTELLSVCGPVLKEAGYEILVFHPYDPEISDAWNMLSYARDFESVDDMVLSIILNTNIGGKGDPYWEQQSNQLLDLICFYLRELLGDGATMNHVQAMAGAAKPADIEVTLKNSPNDKIRLNATGFFSKIGGNDRVISSIMSDLPRRLKLWTMDPIRATTGRNEIDFAELCGNGKVALFVVTPMDKKEQLKPLFSTFFGQLFKVVQERGRALGKLPRPLWFLLDEFANLGAVPGFDNFLTVVRGYGVGVVMGVQSLSQLEELYGRNRAQTIMDACATYIVYPRIGKKDAEHFSQMLGKTTRLTSNRSYSGMKFDRETESAVSRVLMGPDEIRTLDKDKNLIVIAGSRRPVLIAPARYYADPRWKGLGAECADDGRLRERRGVFLRPAAGKEALLVPGEQAMMEEAALITTALPFQGPRKDRQREEEVIRNIKPEIFDISSFNIKSIEQDMEENGEKEKGDNDDDKPGGDNKRPSGGPPPRILKIDKGDLFGRK